MAINARDFFSYRANVSGGSAQNTQFDPNPFGKDISAGTGLFAEVTFGSTGGTASYLSIARWLFGWRYDDTNSVYSAATSLIQVQLGAAGVGPLDSAAASSASGVPQITWTPPGASTASWTLRGHIWLDDGA